MHVTFAEIPGEFQAGERRVLPDAIARALKKEGKVTDMEPWPAPVAQDPPSEPDAPANPITTAQPPAPRFAAKPQRRSGGFDRRASR